MSNSKMMIYGLIFVGAACVILETICFFTLGNGDVATLVITDALGLVILIFGIYRLAKSKNG